MHRPLRTLCLALIATSLTIPVVNASGLPALAAPSGASGQDPAVEAIIAEAEGKVVVTPQPATGKVGFVRVARGGDLAPEDDTRPTAKAETWVDENAEAFGASPRDLTRTDTTATGFGSTVTFTQDYEGIPVFGAELKVNFDSDGSLTSANGFVAPDLALDTVPAIPAGDAAAKAVAEVRADPPSSEDGRSDVRNIHSEAPRLIVYRIGSVKGEAGPAELTWQIEVTNDRNVREVVLVSAVTGKPVNRYSLLANALNRRLSDGYPDFITWSEGEALPELSDEQLDLISSTGDAYWFFANSFGRDSFDNLGSRMTVVGNSAAFQCPNAAWDGARTYFCTGVASDDIVAHEWAHAYTQYTSGLAYQWQSGALNESYSDIWGETIDLINGRQDESEGDLSLHRANGSCALRSDVKALVRINTPSAISKDCAAIVADFGPGPTTTGITSDIVAAIDADEGLTNSSSMDGCSPIQNSTEVTGHIALIESVGGCPLSTKTHNAQVAGASAVVVSMPGALVVPPNNGTLLIPTFVIPKADGDLIRATLVNEPVNVTLSDPTPREASNRWLLGEKAVRPGGPVRDMWTPTCFGDPGKVTDAQYSCGEEDAGGVHQNSGVPNHGYSLLVDGGSYNGVTVPGIGLDKAAAIYWLAQSRTTPLAGFSDHADLLESACADLVSHSVKSLSVTPNTASPSAGTISAGNCQSVSAMIAAVELRAEPTQCNWTPQLAPGAVPDCGAGFVSRSLMEQDFEGGLGSWTLGGSARWSGGVHTLWRTTSGAPGRNGTVAYAPNPDAGNCAGPQGSQTSTDWMASPSVQLPALGTPKLTFDHYVATEAGWDGGLVQISLNDGGWRTVPASAYLYNAPSRTLRTSATSDNPLAGNTAFTGLDGGRNGSWGTSQIDLALAGAAPEDSVQVRFNFGRDTCGGVDGWYVDNVSMVVCSEGQQHPVTLTAKPSGKAFYYGQPHKLQVSATSSEIASSKIRGQIVVEDAAGVAIARGNLAAGEATVTLPSRQPGTSRMRVRLIENEEFQPASLSTTVRVLLAPITIVAKASPKKPKYRENFTLIARISSGNLVLTGKVRAYDKGRMLGSGAIHNGVAKVKVRTNLKRGVHKLTVRYSASSVSNLGIGPVRIRVR